MLAELDERVGNPFFKSTGHILVSFYCVYLYLFYHLNNKNYF